MRSTIVGSFTYLQYKRARSHMLGQSGTNIGCRSSARGPAHLVLLYAEKCSSHDSSPRTGFHAFSLSTPASPLHYIHICVFSLSTVYCTKTAKPTPHSHQLARSPRSTWQLHAVKSVNAELSLPRATWITPAHSIPCTLHPVLPSDVGIP